MAYPQPQPPFPVGLPIKRPPSVSLYSERIDGRPYINCVSYAACGTLRYGAYDVPANYGQMIRAATGVPLEDAHGNPQGIALADLVRGLKVLFPTAPIFSGAPFESIATITAILPVPGHRNRHKAVLTVVIPRMSDLSDHLRRWCGLGYTEGHACNIGGTQIEAATGRVQWWWMDMMADTSTGYAGEWVYPEDVYGALEKNRASGNVKCVYMLKGTAIPQP